MRCTVRSFVLNPHRYRSSPYDPLFPGFFLLELFNMCRLIKVTLHIWSIIDLITLAFVVILIQNFWSSTGICITVLLQWQDLVSPRIEDCIFVKYLTSNSFGSLNIATRFSSNPRKRPPRFLFRFRGFHLVSMN